jgi:hypothetical protein
LNKNENEEISGERLFFLYAWPCLEMREHLGLVEPVDVLALNSFVFVDDGKDPSHELLGRGFPNAVGTFGKFIGDDPLSKHPWPVEMVRAYWRMHKGREPKCAVMYGKVEEAKMLLGNMVKVRLGGSNKMMTVANKYKLAILKKDTVYFHRYIIAEVVLAD